MQQEWEHGSAVAKETDEANPFAPIDYAARLKAPPKHEGTHAMPPPRPGQLYGASPWMSKPKPLSPAAPFAAAPAQRESDPWSGRYTPNTDPEGSVAPSAAPPMELPPYLKRRPPIGHGVQAQDPPQSAAAQPQPIWTYPEAPNAPAKPPAPTAYTAPAEPQGSEPQPARRRRRSERTYEANVPESGLFAMPPQPAEPSAQPPLRWESAAQSPETELPPVPAVPPMAEWPQQPLETPTPPETPFFPFVTDDGQPVRSVFPTIGQPGAPYPSHFATDGNAPSDPLAAVCAQPVDEIAAFFDEKPFANELAAEKTAPKEAGDPASKPKDPAEWRDPFAPAEKAEKPKRPAPKPAASAPPKAEKPPRPPIRVWRVAALVAAAAMLLFCGIVGGRIVHDLAANERDMKEARRAWSERNGSDLRSSAARVDLLPAGQTYAPTATPAPTQAVVTPTPTPIIPINEAAIQSLNRRPSADMEPVPESTPTAPPRTRLNEYPGNPLKNVMDGVRAAHEENRDVIGHLVIEGVLDEWVVQRNNTFYLTHNHHGSASEAGAVFADESCRLAAPPENLLLRGQSAIAGKVFSPLWRYAKEGADFVAANAHANLTTLYEEARYVLFAVIVADNDPSAPGYFNYASHPTFQTDEAMLRYVESARARSLYAFNVEVGAQDRLLTLATLGAGDSTLVLLFKMER